MTENDVVEQTLRELATSKTGTLPQRLEALKELQKLMKQRAREELAKERLQFEKEKAAEETRLRRKEADNASALIALDKIREKTRLMAEQRLARAYNRKVNRQLDKALKELDGGQQ